MDALQKDLGKIFTGLFNLMVDELTYLLSFNDHKM